MILLILLRVVKFVIFSAYSKCLDKNIFKWSPVTLIMMTHNILQKSLYIKLLDEP